jgi:hypothetical protein
MERKKESALLITFGQWIKPETIVSIPILILATLRIYSKRQKKVVIARSEATWQSG